MNGNIKMIGANIGTINEITSDIAVNIQNALENYPKSKVKIALGSLTGVKFLSGIGPDIKIKLSSTGAVNTDLKSEFMEKSINQTVHRVYLQIVLNIGSIAFVILKYTNILITKTISIFIYIILFLFLFSFLFLIMFNLFLE